MPGERFVYIMNGQSLGSQAMSANFRLPTGVSCAGGCVLQWVSLEGLLDALATHYVNGLDLQQKPGCVPAVLLCSAAVHVRHWGWLSRASAACRLLTLLVRGTDILCVDVCSVCGHLAGVPDHEQLL